MFPSTKYFYKGFSLSKFSGFTFILLSSMMSISMEKEAKKPQMTKNTKENIEVSVVKKSSKKWIVIGLVMITVFAGYKYFNIRRQAGVKREAFETQRQVMIDHWEEQGLSDEEIEQNLEDFRQERIDSGERSSGIGIMRLFGGRRSLGK